MSKPDRFAILLSLAAIAAACWLGARVFEQMAHLEDEMAYVWQAQAIAGGRLTTPSPPEPKSFLVPFVVDYQGQRFGKYPPGWPALLGIGEALGARSLVNPLLAGLAVWLIYRLGAKLFGQPVGVFSALLTLVSPFFLLNSGSLLSHPFGLALSAGFVLGWLDAWEDEARWRWLPLLASAACLGMMALTRPLTAVALALPFIPHGLYLFWRKPWAVRRRILAYIGVAALIGGILFAWQFAVTGDALLNPYTLWWPYDRVGFGPGHGRLEGGHTLQQARINTRHSLWVGWHDLFGWGGYSWIFLPFGLLAAIRQRSGRALVVGSLYPILVVVYLAYWIGSWLFGPRYFYEGLYSLTIFSAAGVAFLAGWPTRPGQPRHNYSGWARARPLGMTAILALLLVVTLVFYLPPRLDSMFGLYGVSRARLQPFLQAQERLTPAIVIVYSEKWIEYGALHELQGPFLDTPYLFVIDRGQAANARATGAFPERRVIHYYPKEPYAFYDTPK
jgi:hypothetical protein